MKFIHRLGFYLGGFSIGLVFLFFFLSGKNVSCDYGPEARVKKNINSKVLKYDTSLKTKMATGEIDSTAIKHILTKGKVLFSESSPRQEPCGIYYLEGNSDDRKASVLVENCDSIATVKEFHWK